MRILDISQPVGVATAVWPGDQAFTLGWSMRREAGDSVNVAALTLSVHTGTHVDAPFHVGEDGRRVGELPLDPFLGPALVVDARGRALDEDVLGGVEPKPGDRLLFRTRDRVNPESFETRFAAPTPALASRLVAAGVALVGTDAPSMDPFDSKTLDAHHVLIDGGVAILENLVLEAVRPGRYTLVALPLRLVEADASPVRAVLVEGWEG